MPQSKLFEAAMAMHARRQAMPGYSGPPVDQRRDEIARRLELQGQEAAHARQQSNQPLPGQDVTHGQDLGREMGEHYGAMTPAVMPKRHWPKDVQSLGGAAWRTTDNLMGSTYDLPMAAASQLHGPSRVSLFDQASNPEHRASGGQAFFGAEEGYKDVPSVGGIRLSAEPKDVAYSALNAIGLGLSLGTSWPAGIAKGAKKVPLLGKGMRAMEGLGRPKVFDKILKGAGWTEDTLKGYHTDVGLGLAVDSLFPKAVKLAKKNPAQALGLGGMAGMAATEHIKGRVGEELASPEEKQQAFVDEHEPVLPDNSVGGLYDSEQEATEVAGILSESGFTGIKVSPVGKQYTVVIDVDDDESFKQYEQ